MCKSILCDSEAASTASSVRTCVRLVTNLNRSVSGRATCRASSTRLWYRSRARGRCRGAPDRRTRTPSTPRGAPLARKRTTGRRALRNKRRRRGPSGAPDTKGALEGRRRGGVYVDRVGGVRLSSSSRESRDGVGRGLRVGGPGLGRGRIVAQLRARNPQPPARRRARC